MPGRMNKLTGEVSRSFRKIEKKDRLFFVLSILLSLALFVLMLKAGGYLKWALGIFVIVIIGLIAVISMVKRTKKSDIWHNDRDFTENLNSDVNKTSELIRRALDGQSISRGFLERRLRKIFLRKIKHEKDLSDPELDRLRRSPEGLKELVTDPLLVDLLYQKDHKSEEKNGLTSSQDIPYEEKLKKLIKLTEEDNICS